MAVLARFTFACLQSPVQCSHVFLLYSVSSVACIVDVKAPVAAAAGLNSWMYQYSWCAESLWRSCWMWAHATLAPG